MKELLFSVTKKDFDITYFSGSGAGGQHRNRHKNCVRLRHKETGIITVGQEERSLEANKKKAFENMINNEQFKFWLRTKANEAILKKDKEKPIEEIIQEMLNPTHLKVEIKDENGQWKEEPLDK
jgi:protein subunit release factor A